MYIADIRANILYWEDALGLLFMIPVEDIETGTADTGGVSDNEVKYVHNPNNIRRRLEVETKLSEIKYSDYVMHDNYRGSDYLVENHKRRYLQEGEGETEPILIVNITSTVYFSSQQDYDDMVTSLQTNQEKNSLFGQLLPLYTGFADAT
eukprot:UN04628